EFGAGFTVAARVEEPTGFIEERFRGGLVARRRLSASPRRPEQEDGRRPDPQPLRRAVRHDPRPYHRRIALRAASTGMSPFIAALRNRCATTLWALPLGSVRASMTRGLSPPVARAPSSALAAPARSTLRARVRARRRRLAARERGLQLPKSLAVL